MYRIPQNLTFSPIQNWFFLDLIELSQFYLLEMGDLTFALSSAAYYEDHGCTQQQIKEMMSQLEALKLLSSTTSKVGVTQKRFRLHYEHLQDYFAQAVAFDSNVTLNNNIAWAKILLSLMQLGEQAHELETQECKALS